MKVQRNDKCICGSGKKFKNCCMDRVGEKIQIPDFIICNECGGKAPSSSYKFLDTQGTEGITMAISSICGDCGAPSISASGHPDMVALFMEEFSKKVGGGKMGVDIARTLN